MSSHIGEVITLQFGSYANWTGAHFWNFQVCSIPLSSWFPLFVGLLSFFYFPTCITRPRHPLPISHVPLSLVSPPPEPLLVQDEAQGLAEGTDALAKAYAEVDSGVLYRIGETQGVRALRGGRGGMGETGCPPLTTQIIFFVGFHVFCLYREWCVRSFVRSFVRPSVLAAALAPRHLCTRRSLSVVVGCCRLVEIAVVFAPQQHRRERKRQT